MTTKTTIQNMEKQFDAHYGEYGNDDFRSCSPECELNIDNIKKFIHSHTRSLLSAFAEEVIGKDLRHVTNTKGEKNHTGDVDADEIINALQDDIDAVNEYKNEQRLKAKEIIKSLEK